MARWRFGGLAQGVGTRRWSSSNPRMRSLRTVVAGISILLLGSAPLYTTSSSVRRISSSQPLSSSQSPSAQAALDVEPTGAQILGHFSDTSAPLRRFFARCSRSAVTRYPSGTGSAQILRSMSPNSRRVRCPSASRSQQEPVVPCVLHQPAPGFHQSLLETRERPALDLRRQDQSAPEVAEVVGQDTQLQAHFVRSETMARQPRPVGGLLAFLDPLLRRPPTDHSLVVACARRPITPFMHYPPRPARILCIGRPSTNIAYRMRARHRPTSHAPQGV